MNNSSLYVPREPIFPKRINGFYRNMKWRIMFFTLGIYYLTPWIRWDRGPSLPDQAVLVDILHRRFYFFWIEVWPHEFYFIAGLLIMAGLGLFLFTSALGRVWCGYACPQTVWTDLFILVERWVEGDRNARIRLYQKKWNYSKWRLRILKWSIWLLISVATGGVWVFYFTDAQNLFHDLYNFNAHPILYLTIAILTATTFIFGGFMREQVCIYMCPWPRIQAAMMDEDTLTVAYRNWRGEPRGKKRFDSTGDCIDCMACVNVCPMGIDIRDGQQLECITCALCIDACDDVMKKINKPRGLIDYFALSDETAEKQGELSKPIWKHILRLRTIIYSVLWLAIGIGLIYALFVRTDIELTVSPIRNPIYVLQSDGAVRNIYDVRLRNKSGEDRVFHLSLTSPAILRIDIMEETRTLNVFIPANSTVLKRIYVTSRAEDLAANAENTPLRLWVEDRKSGSRSSKITTFNGRIKNE